MPEKENKGIILFNVKLVIGKERVLL